MSPAWRLLRSSVRGRGREVSELAGWSTLEALPAFLSGRLIAEALDEGFLSGETGTGLAWLGLLAASVIVGAWATRQTFIRLAAIIEPFRDDLARLAVRGALRRSTAAGASGDTAGVARLTQQVEIVREAYGSVLMVAQNFVVVTTGAVLGMVTLMPEVLLLVLPPLVLGLALFFAALAGMAARQRDSIIAEERIAEQGAAVAGGLRDIVACGAEPTAAAMVGSHIEAQARAARELARFTALRTVAVAIGGLLPIILILVAGSWLVSRGATVGTILGALTYVATGVQPALRTLVNGLGGPGLWLMVTLRRIVDATSETARAEAGAPEPPAPARTAWPRPQHHGVRLTGVTFAYGPYAEPVIRNLDLAVPEGDHLAIVGPSGAGKSTLAGVLTGLLEPQEGDVRIGGVPVGQLGAATLAEHRALIPQEAYVFAGSLRENVTYLRPGAPAAELDHAVRALGMRPLLHRLGGYDGELDPEALSAGERQLVTLVRAYLSPARLVVLDEASCHLDPAAEAVVEQAFADRPGTLIVIAHRISSALRARRILVLDGTQAVVGTHADLLRRSPLYRDLVGHWEAGAVPAA